jgi:type IV secretory pathway VirB10-like protein
VNGNDSSSNTNARAAAAAPIESPTGLDLNPKPPNPIRVSKRAGATEAGAAKTDDYLKSIRTAPLSDFEVKAGWEIPAVMEQALNSDLPGEICPASTIFPAGREF